MRLYAKPAISLYQRHFASFKVSFLKSDRSFCKSKLSFLKSHSRFCKSKGSFFDFPTLIMTIHPISVGNLWMKELHIQAVFRIPQ